MKIMLTLKLHHKLKPLSQLSHPSGWIQLMLKKHSGSETAEYLKLNNIKLKQETGTTVLMKLRLSQKLHHKPKALSNLSHPSWHNQKVLKKLNGLENKKAEHSTEEITGKKTTNQIARMKYYRY